MPGKGEFGEGVISIKYNTFLKRCIASVLVVCIAFAVSGCGVMSINTTDLMSPPKATGDEALIRSLISRNANGRSYTLKYPKRGEYGSAIIFNNIDSDDTQEAIAFYQIDDPSDNGVHMVLLDIVDGSWKITSTVNISASEIDRVVFCNLTNHGSPEIIVGCNSNSDALNQLYIYTYSSQEILISRKIDYNYSELIAGDFDADGIGELFLLSTDSYNKSSLARLLKFKEESQKFELIGQTDLDPSASSYVCVKYGQLRKGVYGAFIDSRHPGNNYCTETVYYDKFKADLKNPLYVKDTNSGNPTLRSDEMNSQDIDRDGLTEMPVQIATLNGLDLNSIDNNYFVENIIKWSNLEPDTDIFVTKFNAVMDRDNGFYFIVPASFEDNVLALKNKADNSLLFKKLKRNSPQDIEVAGDLLTIKVFDKNQWEIYGQHNEFTEVNRKGDNVYAMKILDDNNSFGITEDFVKNNLKFIIYQD